MRRRRQVVAWLAEIEAALGAARDAGSCELRQASRALGFLCIEVTDDIADRQALAPGHAVEVVLVHTECVLPTFARDREPGVRASTAGQGSGHGLDVRALQLL